VNFYWRAENDAGLLGAGLTATGKKKKEREGKRKEKDNEKTERALRFAERAERETNTGGQRKTATT
jgi:hypothetical protein